jgi:hypothetical protein
MRNFGPERQRATAFRNERTGLEELPKEIREEIIKGMEMRIFFALLTARQE